MKEELVAGLKNAVERGEPLQKAINSFISAGYNPVEVKEAAKYVGKGAVAIVHEEKKQGLNPVKVKKNKSFKNDFQSSEPKTINQTIKIESSEGKKSSKKLKIIILISVLILLFAGLVTLLILFGEDIISLFIGKD